MQSTAPFQHEFPSGVRLLEPPDIPAAMCLKQAAGWNQTEADWARLLDLQPDGCFAVEQNGALAATATALVYGADLAWIGMVLTAPQHRGQGFARTLMAHAMEFAEGRGAAQVWLDATEMGIALYQRFGFEQDCVVERWGRPALLLPELPSPIPTGRWTPDPELDANAFPTDRLRLLANLAAAGESAGVAGSAYAMGRPGSQAAYFGPCVAKSPATAHQLLHWFLALHPHEAVYWDLLPENQEAVLLARRNGFLPLRRLTRMKRTLRPRALIRRPDSSLVFAIAGFELG
jgi:GNAT superfamily N-acetyltransferase